MGNLTEWISQALAVRRVEYPDRLQTSREAQTDQALMCTIPTGQS